jgi:hypothetical protein
MTLPVMKYYDPLLDLSEGHLNPVLRPSNPEHALLFFALILNELAEAHTTTHSGFLTLSHPLTQALVFG